MPVKAGDLEVVASLRDDVSGKLDKMEGKAATTGKGMEKSLGGIQNAVNAINLDRAAESVRKFGERSSDVTKVRIAFESVAAQAELSDALILESAKEATKGLLTEHDIRLNANKALSLGVVENEQDFANLAEAAIILGQKLGVDAGQAVEDLTTGIGRQSVEILDNLGITLRANEAYAIYAERIGKTAKELTDVEKKQAFTTIAIEKATEAARAQGEIIVTTNDKLEIQKNRLQDVADGYANALGPLAAVGAEMLQLGSQAALVGGIFPGTTAKIGAMGASVGTKLLPLLTGPAGLVAALVAVSLGVKAFYDSMARKEVDEFAEAIEGMTEEVKAETKAHLENVIAVSKARLQNKEFRNEYAIITDQLETAEAKLAALNRTTEEHTEVVEDDGEAVSAVVELTDKQIKALEKAREALKKEREARLESIDETWRHVEALEEMGRRMEKLSNEGLQAAIDSFETAIPDPEFVRDAIKPFEEMMLGKPGKPPLSEEAEKVKDSLEGAARSLVTTVAGGTIGGIFNSLASGDWVGAAQQGITAVWGWLSGKDDERRQAQEQAQAERIRMWEEERQARIDAAREVWEEEKRLATDALNERRDQVAENYDELIANLQGQLEKLGEGFDKAIGDAMEFGLFEPVEQFLQDLPSHIDADALRAKLQDALGDLSVLTGQQSQVTGLQGFIQQYLPKTGLEQFQESGQLSQGAIDEYVAAGGSAAELREFGEALAALNAHLALAEEDRDPEVEQALRDEVGRTAEVLETDIKDVLFEIHTKIGEAKDSIDATKTEVLDPLAKAIATAELWKRGALTAIQTQIDALLAKEWTVEVNMKWPEQPGAGGGGRPSGEKGTAEDPSSNAMGGPFGAGELLRVGERGEELVRFGQPGNVIPNHALGANMPDIVVQIDGEEVARASARHLPGVADEEGW